LLYLAVIFVAYCALTLLSACQNIFSPQDRYFTVTTITVIFNEATDDYADETADETPDAVALSDATTYAAFWGLPAIKFDKWRPNIHIKASSDNGALIGRKWDTTADVNPDNYNLFEYSQILYYDSNYAAAMISSQEDATVDNNVIMPLAFEQKIYKRSLYEQNKYDVSYDCNQGAIVVSLNTANSNYLSLKPGARVAVFATQRPKQWGELNDYTVIDAIPGDNSLQKSSDRAALLDNTSDRSSTRTLSYITYKGGSDFYKDASWDGHWFEGILIEPDKISIFSKNIKDGDTARLYWSAIDTKEGDNAISPFMLFWIAIQQ